MKKYKVIIWGLGMVGKSALKIINQREQLELVGAIDIDPKKVGNDVGLALGLEKMGILISDNVEKVLSLEADVVMYYCPTKWDAGNISPTGVTGNVDDICLALSHKKNVLTTLPVFYSKKNAPEFYERIDKAAKENGVTYTQQGIYPGLYTPYLPTVLGMLNREIESVIVYGGENDNNNKAPWAMVFGFGKEPENVDISAVTNVVFTYYAPTVIEIAERLGLDYDEFVCTSETILADKEVNSQFGVIKPGTIGAHMLLMSCKKNGKEITGFHFLHKAVDTFLDDYPLEQYIEIKGRPNVKVKIEGLFDHEEAFLTSASPNINLIASVVKAEAGYKDALDIPLGYLPK